MMMFGDSRLACLFLAVLIALVAGCGGGGADTSPPTIRDQRADKPSDFSWRGGAVALSATVETPSGVRSVVAAITKPDGSASSVTLQPTGGSTFSGSYQSTANVRSDGQVETYRVTITATDSNGVSGSTAEFTFSVPAPQAPPVEPT